MTARSLEAIQHDMLAALERGPSLIAHSDFSGTRERIILGMKVHANTVSHARLVALEDSFPRLRVEMGQGRFNALSQDYLGYDGVKARTLDLIGDDFSAWLDGAEGNSGAASVARFEWLWLESFHAAEAKALHLVDLAGLGERDLMDLVVGAHPAVRHVPLDLSLHRHLETDLPGLDAASALLLVRPDAEVRILPLTPDEDQLMSHLQRPETISNLLAVWSEKEVRTPEDATVFMSALISLIEYGALVQGG